MHGMWSAGCDTGPVLSMQLTLQQVGEVPGPVLPQNVTGELDLTQGFGPLDNGTAATRGYVPVPNLNAPYFSNSTQVCAAYLRM